MTGRTRRTSQICYDIFDRVFRVGEQLVVLSVVVIAWEKTNHLLILTVFSCILLAALIISTISWAINYSESKWIGGLVGAALIILIWFFGQKVLDTLMLALSR